MPLLPRLFEQVPPVFASDYLAAAPWALLGDTLERVLSELPSQDIQIGLTPDVHLAGDRIVIGKGTRIQPGAVIEGPAFIGQDVDIRPGAYLRGGVWIGDRSIVGANSEIKHAIFFPGARAPHLNYVGDSILGAKVNLGAGTVLSNFRHDRREIRLRLGNEKTSTGRRKLGAILGDGVLTGCNCVLHPGIVVGSDTHLYPGVQLRPGVYPADSVIKLRQELEIVDRA